MLGLILGFILGVTNHTRYIPETEASEKCRELGGDLNVKYELDFKSEEISKGNGFFTYAREKPVFTCTSPSKTLFKY